MIVTFMASRFCFGHCHFFQIHFTDRAGTRFGIGFLPFTLHGASVVLGIGHLFYRCGSVVSVALLLLSVQADKVPSARIKKSFFMYSKLFIN